MSIKTGVKVWRKIAIGSGYRRPRGSSCPKRPSANFRSRLCAGVQMSSQECPADCRLSFRSVELTKAEPTM
jgi:hypothetical protein